MMNITLAEATDALSTNQDRATVAREMRRERAEAVLESLLAAKAECEKQLSRFKRPDLMKSVRGQSAIDAAIESTRRMIESLDRAAGRSAAATVTTVRTTRRPLLSMSDAGD